MVKTTVVVAGPIKCGTSLTAGTLRLLGVNMGADEHSKQHEDIAFQELGFNDKMLAAINARNQKYDLWGFKQPIMRGWADSAHPHLINPHYIYCHRSLYSRITKNAEYGNRKMIAEYLDESSYWGRFFRKHNVPVLVVDFDMSQQQRIDYIVNFLGMSPTKKQIKIALGFCDKETGYQVLPN